MHQLRLEQRQPDALRRQVEDDVDTFDERVHPRRVEHIGDVDPDPMDAPRRTTVGTTAQSASVCSSPSAVTARGKRSLVKVTPWPTKTWSSICTPSQMKVWLEILTRRPTLAPR